MNYYRDPKGQVYRLENAPAANNLEPVAVIAYEDREQVERLTKALGNSGAFTGFVKAHANLLRAALREFANPTPPKPDEPQGLGAVVEDSNGDKWVRMEPRIADFSWFNAADPSRARAWRNIAAVRVLSEGVQP